MEALDLRLRFDAQPGEGPLMANCLWHPDDTASMAIYEDHVYCFGCPRGNGYRWPDELMAELHRRSPVLPPKLETRRSTGRKSRPVEFIPDSMVQTYHGWLMERFVERKEWLLARGLREDTLIANKIGHCGNAFTIPVAGDNGWASIRYRRDDALSLGDVPKYWGTRGANEAMLYRPADSEAVSLTNGCGSFKPEHVDLLPEAGFLCEGELDALRLAQERVIVAQPGRIYICYDQDAPGRVAAGKVAAIIGERANVVTWPEALGKDVTEFLQRWPFSAFERYVAQAS